MGTDREALLAEMRRELASLTGEVRRMARMRWELAELELRSDVKRLKQLVAAWGIAVVLGLAVFPVLAVWLATVLETRFLLPPVATLPALAALLLAGAGGIAWGAWRWFRSRLSGLEETLEELREDAVWLEEWSGSGGANSGQETAD